MTQSNVPKSPKEAKALGQSQYYTGVPCKRGEVAFRRINGDCLCNKCLIFTKELKANWSKENSHKRKQWASENQNKMRQYKKVYAEKNKSIVSERIKNWKEKNYNKIVFYTEKRRSAKLKAIPSWYSDFDEFAMHEAHHLVQLRNRVTNLVWSVDHKIPLQGKLFCGLHCSDNIQVIPASLNYAKMNKMMYIEPSEWIKKL